MKPLRAGTARTYTPVMAVAASAPVTEEHLFHPVLGGLRAAAEAGAWPHVFERLDALAGHHPQDFLVGAEVLARTPGTEDSLWSMLAADPDDRRLAALLAHREIMLADETPPGMHGAHLERAAQERWVGLVRTAEQRLMALCAVDPSDPYPWYLRQVTARLLWLGQNEGGRRFTRLLQAGGFDLAAAHARTWHLCPPWSEAEWDVPLTFARETHAAAPPGEGSEGLVAMAHLRRVTTMSPKEGARWLRTPQVQQELDALGSSLASTPLRPAFAAVRLHSVLGALQVWSGNDAAAQWHLSHLGALFDDEVWTRVCSYDVLPVSRARTKALASPPRTSAPSPTGETR